jgi:site-specific DNA-methyltransferase (adenine-specific)
MEMLDEPNLREPKEDLRNSIHLGDCLEIMKQIPDAGVDLILCDLPYGTTACKWDAIIPFSELWKHYKRVIRPNGAIVLFCSQPFTSALIMSNPNDFKYCWTWDKVKPNGHLVAKIRPMQRTEDIAVFGSGKIKYNPQMTKRDKPKKSKEYSRTEIMGGEQTNFEERTLNEKYPQSVLEFSNASQVEKLHPTQKPLELLQYLIRTYTDEEQIVLDNTMGSGSTCVACKNENRIYIGIEQEEKYYKIAEQRLTSLF